MTLVGLPSLGAEFPIAHGFQEGVGTTGRDSSLGEALRPDDLGSPFQPRAALILGPRWGLWGCARQPRMAMWDICSLLHIPGGTHAGS